MIMMYVINEQQGGSIASVFITEPGWQVRGITRDPSKPSAQKWTQMGAEVVAGDFEHVDTLKTAFSGANVIYGLTDMWQHMQTPTTYEQAAREGRTPNEVAFDLEVAQGKNLVDAAAANIDTLDRFIFASLSDTKRFSGGKITFNLHFDSKVAIIEYLKSTYPELWRKTSLLQLGLFLTNWKAGMGVPQKGDDGVYRWSLPVGGERAIPFVDPVADTGRLTKALVQLPAGTHLVGAGSKMSFDEYAALWGRLNGVEAIFERQDPSILEEAMGSFGKEIIAMFDYIEEFGYDGSDPEVVYPWDLPSPIKVTSAEEYIQKEDWSSIL